MNQNCAHPFFKRSVSLQFTLHIWKILPTCAKYRLNFASVTQVRMLNSQNILVVMITELKIEFLGKTFSIPSQVCTYENMHLPRLRSKTIPSQLKDLKAKAKENRIFVAYWPHQDTEKHSLQEKLTHLKVIFNSQIAQVISCSTPSNSEELSTGEELHTVCALTSLVLSPKCRQAASAFDVQAPLAIEEFLPQDIKKRAYCLLCGHYISVAVSTVKRLSLPRLQLRFLTD